MCWVHFGRRSHGADNFTLSRVACSTQVIGVTLCTAQKRSYLTAVILRIHVVR
jgi:hypothetical protein